MRKKLYKNSSGFTLVELIIAISLISFVIVLSTNMVIMAVNTHKATTKEYALQSDIRIAAEKTNNIVRYSKAVFAVPHTFVESTDKMDSGWDYLMVSPDGKRIVAMEYNSTSSVHEENVLVKESENIRYEVLFEKDTGAKSDSVLNYKILAFTTDESGKKIGDPKIAFETTLETINALQVADKGTLAAPSIALAYRSDGQTSGKGKNQIAYVTLVVDVSGSMGYKIDKKVKIDELKKALAGDNANPDKGIIQQFSKEENIFVSMVPFSTTGNYPDPTKSNSDYDRHTIYEVYLNDDKNSLVSLAKSLKAQGGTNTGDGLRQSYFLHDDFRTRMLVNEKDQVHHYMIVLVDGETTYEVEKGNWSDEGYYSDRNTYDWRDGRRYWRFEWRTNWGFTSSNQYFNLPGNIIINNKPNDDSLDYVKSELYDDPYYWDPYWRDLFGKKNATVASYDITGNGSKVISNSGYVSTIGNMTKNFDEGNGIKSYIIGYANNMGTHINSIGTAIGTDSENIYAYDDPGFDLEEVFRNIANDIMADFWLVSGPQIQD
ncbi:MAG: prepilin-type N-terminal cleavage/methylation domain-containing protein [Acholeplasma sp.]|nr:prepilin-type N-terminal cleavage/methylation domain-containing protein [Acholeplasma sp.]